jgi:hypothetical protein
VATIHYEMTYDTLRRWVRIHLDLQRALAVGDAIQRDQLINELHNLPSYPHGAHPTEDKIVPVVKRNTIARVLPRLRAHSSR